MPTFRIKAEETVELMYEVEAPDFLTAIEMVEDGDEPGAEIDSRGPEVTEYAIEGQMGWNKAP